jgi:hypothetical protein
MNNDLVTRVRAAMDETERLASAALNHPDAIDSGARLDDGVWEDHGECVDSPNIPWGSGINLMSKPGGVTGEQAQHIAHHDPKRELRKVAVDRRLLDHAVAHCAKYDERAEAGDRSQIEHGAAMYEIVVQLAAGYGIELPEVAW